MSCTLEGVEEGTIWLKVYASPNRLAEVHRHRIDAGMGGADVHVESAGDITKSLATRMSSKFCVKDRIRSSPRCSA